MSCNTCAKQSEGAMGAAGVQASQTQAVFEQGKPENVLYRFLALAVPARIEALQRQEGGVSAEDFTRVTGYTDALGVDGDALIYPRRGKSAEMAAKLIDALAVLAFVPGGVTFGDLHFEAEREKSR